MWVIGHNSSGFLKLFLHHDMECQQEKNKYNQRATHIFMYIFIFIFMHIHAYLCHNYMYSNVGMLDSVVAMGVMGVVVMGLADSQEVGVQILARAEIWF